MVEIELKHKYTIGGRAPKQNHHSDNQRQKPPRRKITQQQKNALPPQPEMVMYMNLQNKTTTMMTRQQFISVGGWP